MNVFGFALLEAITGLAYAFVFGMGFGFLFGVIRYFVIGVFESSR